MSAIHKQNNLLRPAPHFETHWLGKVQIAMERGYTRMPSRPCRLLKNKLTHGGEIAAVSD